MSELPRGWVATTLGKLAAWGSGGTPSRSEPSYYGGTIPWIKTGELGPRLVESAEETITEAGLANSSAKLFPAGSVAIAMYGATIGKTSILGISATTNQACAVGIPHPEATSKEYLYHFLCSQKDAFIEAGKGGAQPNISQGVIKDWKIALAPLPEQKRIADKLDSTLARVEACRDRLDRLPALLKRIRQSILTAATSGRLTEDWRATRSPDEAQRNPGASTPDTPAIDLPTGWEWSCPEEIKTPERYALAIGPFGSNLKVPDYRSEGVPLVFVREIRARSFGGLQTKYVTPEKAEELRAHSVSGGDLLITKMGDPPGDTAIYPVGAPDAIITADCIKLRVNRNVALPQFVQAVLESPLSRLRLQEITAGVAQQKISLERFRNFPIQLASLEEQHEIVRRVETLFAFADRLEARLATARKQAEQLTPALLAKAFRGELVPQDPNDEPASELLKRLAANRSQAPKARRGRKAVA